LAVAVIFLVLGEQEHRTLAHIGKPPSLPATFNNSPSTMEHTISRLLQYFINYPVPVAEFGELGYRVQILQDFLTQSQEQIWQQASETLALSLFPFIRNPTRLNETKHLKSLRQSFIPNSQGIVIASGKGNFRFAGHLISSLRTVLHSRLPIQIAYAGDIDLPLKYRQTLEGLGNNVSSLDVLTVLDDSTLKLTGSGWAIKPFAILASQFEQVLFIDADAVLLQPPEVIFDQHMGYRTTGALLFHDRLSGENGSEIRQNWWRRVLRKHQPSEALQKSIAFNNGWAFECDSGVLAFDKARLSVLGGL
jgi:hypothetical protein